jgi:hypothetical protein
MTPPTGPYVSPKIDPTKPDGGHPLAEEDWIAAQLHPDLPRPTDTAITRALQLTCIGQAVAMPARKQAVVVVHLLAAGARWRGVRFGR